MEKVNNVVVNRNEKAAMELAALVNGHYVGCDTNIFMHDAAERFFPALKQTLIRECRTCFTINEVYEELKKQAASDNLEKKTKAQRGLCFLQDLVAAKLLTVYESAAVNVPFADAAWLSLFSQMRLKHKIVLVTQDRKLAKDVIEKVNGADSVNGNVVKVRRINGGGQISSFHFTFDDNGHIIEVPTSSTLNKLPVPDEFRLPVVSVDEGDKLHGAKGQVYTIGEEINYGREGSIWTISESLDMIAKIFAEPTNRKFEKVKHLSALPAIEGAVMPTDILIDTDGHFAGYLMQKIDGVPMEALFTTRGQQRHAPQWSRLDYVKMARALVKLCGRLQNAGILVGDVNAANFLVDRDENGNLDAEKILAIDLDSAQVAGKKLFPAEGITLNYASPEHLRGGIQQNAARSNESLQYSVALLALQCVLCGVHAFRICSEDGSTTLQDAMKAEQLPFGTSDVRRTEVSPSGVEKLWSNMPAGTKTFFHSIFQKGGTRNAVEKRPALSIVEKELTNYINWMEDPSNQTQFPEILSTQPQHLKPFYATCANKGCGKKFVVRKFRQDGRYFCPECLDHYHNGIAEYKICPCGSVFAVRNFEKRDNPRLCPTCRSRAETPSASPASSAGAAFARTTPPCSATMNSTVTPQTTIPPRNVAASTVTQPQTTTPKSYSPRHSTASSKKQQSSFFEFLKQSIGF